MGRLTNLNPPTPIADADLPESIARDSEIAAAIAAHVLGHPHPQYEFKAGVTSRELLGVRNFPANTWTSLGAFPGFSLGVQGFPSALLVAIGITWDYINAPWQQTSGAGILSPIWWQPAVVADEGIRVAIEYHNQTQFFIRIRAGLYSGDLRPILINPESEILIPSTGRLNVILKRLL